MNPVRLGVLLDRVTRKMGVVSRLRQYMAVEIWPRIVGPEIARQTRAGPVRDRILFVHTPNPVLAHHLALTQEELLVRYRQELDGRVLRGIHVHVGEVEAPREEVSVGTPARGALSPAEEEKLCALAGAIPDSGLAGAYLRAARAWALARAVDSARDEEAYMRLVTGDRWLTAAEFKKALTVVGPGRRAQVRDRAAHALRAKIVIRLKEAAHGRCDALALRGDLRRLAIVLEHPLAGDPREIASDLLGPEDAALWPDEE